MSKRKLLPNEDIYAALQGAADHFNEHLFEGKLPPVVITLQRGRNTFGYFSPDQWAHSGGRLVSEIAINPAHFAKQSLLQMFQTIAHELCHLWQHTYGKPTRPGYHNQEWADKMEEIGLVPSSTGAPGGERVGQKMSDYPAVDGHFLSAAAALVDRQGFALNWVDRGFDVDQVYDRFVPEVGRAVSHRTLRLLNTSVTACFKTLQVIPAVQRIEKRKIKYECPSCQARVWGKPGLAIQCTKCDQPFADVPSPQAA